MKRHIALILISSILAGFSAASIVTFTDPYTSGLLTHIFLYLSLFLAVLGISTTLGVLIRQGLGGMYIINLSHSFRQAIFISILVISFLLLSHLGLLVWWVEATLVLFFVFLEIFLNLKS